jgi:Subtilase family
MRWIGDLLRWLRDLMRRPFRQEPGQVHALEQGPHHDHEHGPEPQHGPHPHDREPPLPPEFGETTDSLGKSGVYVYVKGELLIGNQDLREALAHLRRRYPSLQWNAVEPAPIAELETSVVPLPAEAPPVPEIIDALVYDERTSGLSVSPNHVLAWNSHPKFIPVGPPVPPPNGQAAQAVVQAINQVNPTAAAGPVGVGVLDTGVIRNSLPAARCSFRDPEDVDVLDLDGDGKLDRHAGHGTFVAGVVLHRTLNATVTVRRVEPATAAHDGYTTDKLLAEALRDWRLDAGFKQLRVLNLSISGGTANGAGLSATRDALNLCRQVSPDLVVVAGAGNDNTTAPTYPANFKDVVAVGALHDTTPFRRACFSNLGSWVDACAPGVHVVSTFLQWQQQLAPYPPRPAGCQAADVPGSTAGNVNFNMVAEWRGTSFAAPVVAAWIANRIATGGVSGKQAVDDLRTGAFPGLQPPLPNLGRVVWPPF